MVNSYRRIATRLLKRLYAQRYLFLLILGIFVVFFLFLGFFKMIFFLILFAFLNIIISYSSRGLPRISTSFELIMFGTILSGLAYGSKVGAVFGFILPILYYYGAGRFSIYVTVYAPLYAIVGGIVPFFSSQPLFIIGMYSTIIYSIISSLLITVLYAAKIHRAIIFIIVNTVFNLIIFKYLGATVLKLMR